jgi:cation-transporting ATPase 13A3/4/5
MDSEIDVNGVNREEAECDLNFLGFLIFENRLKEASERTIKSLQESQIKTIMATGDNIETAVNVAKQCNIVAKE